MATDFLTTENNWEKSEIAFLNNKHQVVSID
jgi:hypothetical protein